VSHAGHAVVLYKIPKSAPPPRALGWATPFDAVRPAPGRVPFLRRGTRRCGCAAAIMSPTLFVRPFWQAVWQARSRLWLAAPCGRGPDRLRAGVCPALAAAPRVRGAIGGSG